MGRKAVPDEIKKIRGTDQPCRTNPDKPQFTQVIGAGPAPEHLSPEVQEIYNQICYELINVGILQNPDVMMVLLLCDQYEIYFEARRILSGRSKFQTQANGLKKVHPAVGMMKKALDSIIKISSELGLSPASRQRIKVPKKDDTPKDPAASLIN